MSQGANEPLILITNDDGIQAGGIRALAQAMIPFGRVVVVAPDRAQSGMGHAVTINGILKMEPVHFEVDGVAAAWQTTGTPVDCVKLAIYEILGKKPDLLLSGINHGSNASINVIYSGTMSAAVEGAVEGIPSIGFSLLNHATDADFSACVPYVKQLSEQVLKRSLPEGICLNVNFPNLKATEIKGMKVCRQSAGYWEDAFDKRTSPGGSPYFWMTGKFTNPDQGQDTDEWALRNGFVSVVPTQFDLTAHHAISTLNQWDL
ncbi:MAG: 5'/3'-nucleotidase SurE [Bacteroidetes bacterium]|nr:5'/3'-nucleotidase SurE [Bacteroidota bacterium]MDA1336412.1 5'/3'-nucleotidase SurE [Bacteroidota bacterium]